MKRWELKARIKSLEYQLKLAREENLQYAKEELARWEKDNSIYYDFDNHTITAEKWYPVLELYRLEKQIRCDNGLTRLYNYAFSMIDRNTLHVTDSWTLIYKGVIQEKVLTSLL